MSNLGRQFNRPLQRPAEYSAADFEPGAPNYPRKKFDVHATRGKAWDVASAPHVFDDKGNEIEKTPGTFSIITPKNEDAWESWPRYTDKETVNRAKKAVKTYMTSKSRKSTDPKVRLEARKGSYKANQIQASLRKTK